MVEKLFLKVRNVPAILISLGLVIIIFSQMYPGLISIDTIIQLTQAKTMDYSDWHPPVMSLIMTFIGLILPVVQTMILAQILSVCLGSYLLFKAWSNQFRGFSAYWLIFMPLLPYFFNLIGVLWKDVQFAASLFFAICLIEYCFALVRNRKVVILFYLGAFIFISYAQIVRGNGFFLSFFVFLYVVHQFMVQLKVNTKFLKSQILLISLFLTVFIHGLNNFIAYRVLNVRRDYPIEFIMLYDLVGISYYAKEDLLPKDLKKTKKCDNKDIITTYDPRVGDLLFSNTDSETEPCRIKWYYDEGDYTRLQAYWVKTIFQNLGAYLQHRLHFSIHFLRLNSWTSEVAYYTYTQPNDYGLTYKTGIVRTALWRVYFLFRNTPFFFPWFYLTFMIFVLGYQLWNRITVVPYPILAGCLCYLTTYFIIGFGPFYRYVYVVPILLTPYLLRHQFQIKKTEVLRL